MPARQHKFMRNLVPLSVALPAASSRQRSKRPTHEMTQATAILKGREICVWQSVSIVQTQLVAGGIAFQRRQRRLLVLSGSSD